MKKIVLLIALVFLVNIVFSQDYRYVKTIFSSSQVTKDVVYSNVPALNSPYMDESNTSLQNLVMDIYQPNGDVQKNRPVIIFAHGGGFITGNRNHDDAKAFCDSFARKGYVAVSIEYRQGVFTLSDAPMHYTRAVYRGLQDGRSAIRFLRSKASTYGIDANKIYFAGSSAGAFIGLHIIYLDIPFEKPTYAGIYSYGTPIINAPDLGDLDIGQNIGYSGEPNGVISFWGAIASTNLITYDNNKPVFLVHGTSDVIVPFKIGAPFQVSTFPQTYGSYNINNKLIAEGINNQITYFVSGQGHEFYGAVNGMWSNGTNGNAYWDTIIQKSGMFLYKLHKPTANFLWSPSKLVVNFSDKTSGSVAWKWDFGDGSSTSTLKNPSHSYTLTGTYFVHLYVENNSKSWDTITKKVVVDGVSEINEVPNNSFLIYPNPFYSCINLDFNHTGQNCYKNIIIYDLFGKIIWKNHSDDNSFSIEMSNAEKGIYFILIKTEKENWVRMIQKVE